ncbi:MAG: hypothetical protein AAF253_00275 [Pseudomonadota bacterium]
MTRPFRRTATSFTALTAASALLAGCIIIDDDDAAGAVRSEFNRSGPDYSGSLGTVFGATIGVDTVSFQVSSNGCTDERYFNVDVDRLGDQSYAVSIDRTQADSCNSPVANGTAVTYSFDTLGLPPGASVQVRNPIRRR